MKMERLILITPVLMKMRMDGFMRLNPAMQPDGNFCVEPDLSLAKFSQIMYNDIVNQSKYLICKILEERIGRIRYTS
mgnify:CR=1 FL=1